MTDTQIIKEMFLKTKKIIVEQQSQVPISKEEIAKQEEELKNTLQTPIKFEEFKVFDNDIKWKMKLVKYDLDVTLSLEDVEGIYIFSTSATQVTEEFINVIKKLKSFYDSWNKNWSQKLV